MEQSAGEDTVDRMEIRVGNRNISMLVQIYIPIQHTSHQPDQSDWNKTQDKTNQNGTPWFQWRFSWTKLTYWK